MSGTVAKVGTTVSLPTGVHQEMEEHQVGAPCKDPKGGLWACATHGEFFANNLQAGIHEGDGEHVVVWWCWVHGAESDT